jgi:hypothetical protein
VVAPQVPAGIAVGQAVLGDQPDSQALDAEGVAAVGQDQVGEVGGEAQAATGAAVARERDHQFDGPLAAGIAEVVEGAPAEGVASGACAAAWAAAAGPVTAELADARPGKILDARDALRGVRDVLSRARHGMPPDAGGFRRSHYACSAGRRVH